MRLSSKEQLKDRMVKTWNEICEDPVGAKMLEETFTNFDGFYKEVLKQTAFLKIKYYSDILRMVIK